MIQEDKEKKRLDQLERKKELQKLHDEEMASVSKRSQEQPSRLTRAQIEQNIERERWEKESK